MKLNEASASCIFTPLTLISNLGALLKAQGDLKNAALLLREALAVRRATLGDTHPDTLTSINNLGMLLYISCRVSSRGSTKGAQLSAAEQRGSSCRGAEEHAAAKGAAESAAPGQPQRGSLQIALESESLSADIVRARMIHGIRLCAIFRQRLL